MRLITVAILSVLLSSCNTGWEARSVIGTETDGARYYYGWLFGGPAIYVYPSGTVHTRYEGGTSDMRIGSKLTYVDDDLWKRISEIVDEKGGKDPIDLTTDEGSYCDGGYETLSIKIGNKTAYYEYDDMDCEITIKRYDAAGLEIKTILSELADKLRQR